MMSKLPLIAAAAFVLACALAASTRAEEREPYQYQSLKDAPDAEILRFMADGKSELDVEFEAKFADRLPDGFWTADPKAAALALVDANRKPEHRAAYSLVLPDVDPTQPPTRCTVTLANFSSRCYNAVDRHYFLRADSHESYLAYVESWSGGEAFYNVVHDQPAFNFRLCTVSYEDARRITDIIWWLNRIQTKKAATDSSFTGATSAFSTADGSGKLILRGEGNPPLAVGASDWADYLGERWSGDYEPEVLFNFAAYLIQRALPEHLGPEWSKFEPKHQPDFDFNRIYVPAYQTEERQHLSDLASRFLDWFALDQEKISFAIVAEAARVTGRFGMSAAAGRLRAIEKALPPAGGKHRSGREVLAALDKLPREWDVRNETERARIEQQRAALEAELDWHLYDRGANSADNLRESVTIALRRLALGNDAPKLEAWALSKSEGMQWAMQRLAQLDKKRYATVLETFSSQGEAKWARQFFDELIKVDPKRARAIAHRLTATRRDALAISAFLVLRDAAELPDEQARVSTIIKILDDPKTGSEDLGRAIDLLVPHDAPLRYPDRRIDEALVRLLDRKQKLDDLHDATRYATRALARRGRTEFFERIAAESSNDSFFGVFDEVLGALTQLAQADPARLNVKLTDIVKPHLAATNQRLTELFWAIWAADLHGLEPDVRRLATQSPEEIENRKADSSGGEVTNVTGGFHFARKIASLWSEPDPFTRARLLIAFTVAEPYPFVRDDVPERVARMKAEMLRTSDNLSPEEKQQLAAMLDRIDADQTTSTPAYRDDEIRRKATAFARQALRL